jgi:phospholipid transport system transporter-binding protein
MSGRVEAVLETTPEGHRLSGALVQATATRLLRDGERAIGAGILRQLDLAGVTAIDSAGVAVLITWVSAARSEGRPLTFVGWPGAVVTFVRAAGVESLLGL